MGMVACPECGEQISTSASACPKCGKVLKKKKSGCGKIALIVLGVFVLAGIVNGITGSGGSSRSTASGSPSYGGSNSNSSSSTSRNDTEVTYAEYLEIENGMSYSEVVAIVGFEGEEMSRNNIAGYESILYSFSNRFGTNMIITIQDGGVTSKSQIGLD
ncbi:MAG: zinc-ribbon domain-containing protein [Candidatus Sabulitectum sp.]|nr:zinc-ribbon domain-containing protein [Candidatus Sabulitectum sp.]